MADIGAGQPAPVRLTFDSDVWEEEVGRFGARSRSRGAAERARRELERSPAGRRFQRCSAEGDDRTRLAGCVKAYVPLDRTSSEAPFGFVFEVGVDDRPPRRIQLTLLAFGERHPVPGTRSLYERAHKRLHGRYPDQ